MNQPLRIVALISGGGTNLQSIIDNCSSGAINADVVAVFSNRPGVYGLRRADIAGIPNHTLDHRTYSSRVAFDAALQKHIDRYSPELVVQAGFMRILTADLVDHYAGRMLNVHPSLLPDLPGLDTHQRALDKCYRRHGASIHFVTPELDSGPLVIQAAVDIKPDDTVESLSARVLIEEHRIYSMAIGWFAAGRLHSDGLTAWLDDEPIRDALVLGKHII
jgi:phosphoribosylglycinamide formyltransferase-1